MAKTTDYTTDKKEEFRKLNPKTQDVETWYRIWATSKGGTYFHVEVPGSELGKADEPLTRRAKEIDAI